MIKPWAADDHSFIAYISKEVHKTTIDLNVVELLAGRTSSVGHAPSGQFALAAAHALTKHVGIQGEISGFSRNDEQSGALFQLDALTYQASSRLVLDGGVRFGLTHQAPVAGVFAGLTIGVGDLYKKHGH